MNNFELHEQAEQMTVGNSAYKLARRVIELEQELKKSKVLEKLTVVIDVDFLGKELPELVNKIKAEAVREAIGSALQIGSDDIKAILDSMRDYANKLEAGES